MVNTVFSLSQQIEFIVDTQFGVFETHLLGDLNGKYTFVNNIYYLNLSITEIGQWFEGEIKDEVQFDAVISNASFFLESMLTCMHMKPVQYLWHTYFFLVLMAIDNLSISGNILIRDLRTKTSNLTLQISTLNESLTNLRTICNNSSLCDFLSSTEFGVKVNYTDVSLQLSALFQCYI